MSLFINNTKQLISGIITEFNKKFWDLYVSKKGAFLKLKIYKSFEFYFYPYGYITERLYRYSFLKNGVFEPKTFELLDQHIKPGQTVLDIGANIGIYSLYFSRQVGPNGKIIAFEPDKHTFSILKKNLEKNNCANVIPSNCALSNFDGVAHIGLPPDLENENLKYKDAFNIVEQVKASDNNADPNSLTEVRILDNYIQELGVTKVDLIKIDIEGAELLCFEGAVNILKTQRPVIIFEGDEERVKNFDYNLTKLLIFINNLGYKLTNYDHGQWLAIPNEQ
jgi:FkbM family methyltransferase